MAKGTIALGQFRGKVGGQVLRVVDGKQVIQSYQPSIRNPKTTAQEMQRAAMRRLGKLARGLKRIIKTGFGGSYFTGAFIKKNISRLTSVLSILTPDDVTTNYSALQITNGNAEGLVVFQCGTVDYGTNTHLDVRIPISNVSIAAGISADRVRLVGVAYSPDLNRAVMTENVPTTATAISMLCPAAFDGMEVHVWAFAVVASEDADDDAFDQTNLRLPLDCIPAYYCGSGEVA